MYAATRSTAITARGMPTDSPAIRGTWLEGESLLLPPLLLRVILLLSMLGFGPPVAVSPGSCGEAMTAPLPLSVLLLPLEEGLRRVIQ